VVAATSNARACFARWVPPLAVYVLAGCGPSFEAIQEGDLRFAHCDRLDLDETIAPSHRLHCWREWRRVYTYGQTRDRVDYAQRRIAEVVSGDTEPSFELPSAPAAAGGPTGRASSGGGAPGLRPVVAQSDGSPLRGSDSPGSQPSLGGERCLAAHATCEQGCKAKSAGCEGCARRLETCKRDTPP
jgi:hypothetical protein